MSRRYPNTDPPGRERTFHDSSKVLSAYMIAQTLGIIGAQGLLTLGDAGTAVLFIGASILVSISLPVG